MSSPKYSMESIESRAKGFSPGPVLPEEVDFARNILIKRSGDIVGALYVVGLCGKNSDSALIENYLHGEDNNLYADTALKALVRYLGFINKYRNLLRELVFGPPDEGGNRRMTAIHLMPIYFNNYVDNELGCKLVSILCDFEDVDRLAARNSLADILEIRSSLNDPHGIKFEGWDDDSNLLVETARKRFNCPAIDMNIGAPSH